MAEWSKAHAWKVCNRQKWFMGSNPILSASTKPTFLVGFVFLSDKCFKPGILLTSEPYKIPNFVFHSSKQNIP